MRKFATLRKVDSTEPIPGAERVELAVWTVGGACGAIQEDL